jgi:hypothetical protein
VKIIFNHASGGDAAAPVAVAQRCGWRASRWLPVNQPLFAADWPCMKVQGARCEHPECRDGGSETW